MLSGSDFPASLQSALCAMAVFYGIGWIFGELARRVVEESVLLEIRRLRTEQQD